MALVSSPLSRPYPGSQASVDEIIDLANAYYSAAITLLETGESLQPMSYAPARMCALHAIELYMNAFLRHEGRPPEEIRGRMHNLADSQIAAALKLKPRTARHLEELSARREYLLVRYAPEQTKGLSELNRLLATLVEIMTNVGGHLKASGARPEE